MKNVLEFWRDHQQIISLLSRVAKDLLGLQISSGDIERVTKKLEEMYYEKRNLL